MKKEVFLKSDVKFKIFCTILFILSILPLCYAGTTKFFDLGKIDGQPVTAEKTMREFEALRFRFNGVECRVGILGIHLDDVSFYFSSQQDIYAYRDFKLVPAEQYSLDIDNDGKIDAYITLNNIIIALGKERLNATFSSVGSNVLADNVPKTEIAATNQITPAVVEKPVAKEVPKVSNPEVKTVQTETAKTEQKPADDTFKKQDTQEPVFVRDTTVDPSEEMSLEEIRFGMYIWGIVLAVTTSFILIVEMIRRRNFNARRMR